MPSLFGDGWPIVQDQLELEIVLEQHPGIDPYFIASACIPDRRVRFETLWERFAPYADNDFRHQADRNFHARSWEMYLGVIMLERGMSIRRPSRGEPDIRVVAPVPLWMEAVAVTPGVGDDAVDVELDRASEFVTRAYPEDGFLLRVCGALTDKRRQLAHRLESGAVDETVPYVIAVNTSAMNVLDLDPPIAVRAAFGIGHLAVPLQGGAPFLQAQAEVPKASGASVPLGLLLGDDYAPVSALVFSNRDVLNHPEPLGEDLYVVHNPRALQPLPDDLFGELVEYRLDERSSTLSVRRPRGRDAVEKEAQSHPS